MPQSFTVALLLMGVAAVTGQIVLMRELLVLFHGNELSTALILAVWLVWNALGSLISSRVADALPGTMRWFACGLALLALLLPASILAVRLSRLLWGIPLGETVGLDQMLLLSLTVCGPYCFCAGFLFALGCGVHAETTRTTDSSPGHVYWLEAIGSGLGGILFAVLVLFSFNHLQSSLLVSLVLILVAARLAAPHGLGRIFAPQPIRRLLLSLVLVFSILALHLWGAHWERTSRQWEWQGFDLLAATETLYGNLAAITNGNEISFYENGLWMFTAPDAMSAEHSVHFALLAHPQPRTVLLVSGGLSGSLAEILKHPSVERVDYVELDPRMIAFGRRVLPAEATAVLDDPRVRLVFTDGRTYINRSPEWYDVVLVNLPDPKTAQLNRYYTREFFQEAGRVLARGGLLCVGLTSSESIVGPGLAQTLASLYRTMEGVFEHVAVVPGATARFLGSLTGDGADVDPVVLTRRIAERNLHLLHVRQYYLDYNLSQGRRAYLEGILQAVPGARINRDLSPSCYYYDLLHWSRSHAPAFEAVLLWLEALEPYWLLLVPALAAALLAAFNVLRDPLAARRSALRGSCLVMGFSEMALSVVVILVFQIFYGYLYFQLALLIAMNMLGMALGGRYMLRRMQGLSRPWNVLWMIQAGMSLYCLIFLGAVSLLYPAHPQLRLPWAMELGFSLWAMGAGILGGLHFPLAGKLYLLGGCRAGRGGGVVYGMDLAGSAVGAVAVGLLLLPVAGVTRTLILIACWNLLAVGVLLAVRRAQ